MTDPTMWETLHLPVLKEVVRTLNSGELGGASSNDLARALEIEPAAVVTAFERLADAGLIETRAVSHEHARATGCSERAQQLAGEWPSPEDVADRLVEALKSLAENAETPEERSKARKALDAITSLSRDVLVSLAGAAIGRAIQ